MAVCEVYPIAHAGGFRWKWRLVGPEGRRLEESDETYQLYFDCVCAARERGYQPRPEPKCR